MANGQKVEGGQILSQSSNMSNLELDYILQQKHTPGAARWQVKPRFTTGQKLLPPWVLTLATTFRLSVHVLEAQNLSIMPCYIIFNIYIFTVEEEVPP